MLEPLTIDAEVIADYLDSQRRHGMASFVRHLGREDTNVNKRQMDLLARIHELESKYEPRTAETPHDPRPPANASD